MVEVHSLHYNYVYKFCASFVLELGFSVELRSDFALSRRSFFSLVDYVQRGQTAPFILGLWFPLFSRVFYGVAVLRR